MFISSMANKNTARFQELAKPNAKQKKKEKHQKEEFLVTGESANVFVKNKLVTNTSLHNMIDEGHLKTSGSAPRSCVSHLYNLTEAANHEKYEFDTEEFDVTPGAVDSEWEVKQRTSRKDDKWFTTPIHRPDDESKPYLDLVQTKPLTASLMKAKSDGTLKQDYEEDLTKMNVDDFDMEIFQKADRRLYNAQFESMLDFKSPYHFELAKLRREKLKLEESHLLELRCQAELEETRGPKPRWYELKTKHFNKELKKNNDIIEDSHDWKTMFDYRSEVVKASRRWENLAS